ncbi:MAG: T9SS type A sorting domain-containing protein [Paludibacter sp.]
MKQKFYLLLMVLIPVLSIQSQTTFYVDPNSTNANDANEGTSSSSPWMSLNATKWTDGCTVVLAATTHAVLAKATVTVNVTLQGTAGSTKDNVIIEGLTADDIARGSETPQFFAITGTGSLSIKNMTIRNSQYAFATGKTDYWGGMFNVSSTATLTLENVNVENANLALRGGGAIYSTGTLNCTNVLFQNCISSHGAAVCVQGTGIANFESCTFKANSTQDGTHDYKFGGALKVESQTANVTINKCYFDSNTSNDDMTLNTKSPAGGAIAFRLYAGCDAKLKITNSTFSKNYAYGSGGAILIDKVGSFATTAGKVNLQFVNNTFYANYCNATHGTAFIITGGSENGLNGTISFINNTFFKNGPSNPTAAKSSLFFNDLGVDFSFINNIVQDRVWDPTLLKYWGYGLVVNLTKPTQLYKSLNITGSVFDGFGGSLSTAVHLTTDSVGKLNNIVKLDSVLTVPATGVPYLKLNQGSLAIEFGKAEFLLNGLNLVPALDIRGIAKIGASKDAGAYEYDGPTAVNEILKNSTFAYPNPFTDMIYLPNLVKSISVFDLAGVRQYVQANVSKLNTSNLQTGLYIVQVVNYDGTVIIQKMQK